MCYKPQQGSGKLETLSATGQALEGVSQVPLTTIFTVNPVTAFQVQVMVNAKPVYFMIDTGAAVSLINLDCWHGMRTPDDKLDSQYKPGLVGVNGSSLQVAGTTQLHIHISGLSAICNFLKK